MKKREKRQRMRRCPCALVPDGPSPVGSSTATYRDAGESPLQLMQFISSALLRSQGPCGLRSSRYFKAAKTRARASGLADCFSPLFSLVSVVSALSTEYTGARESGCRLWSRN